MFDKVLERYQQLTAIIDAMLIAVQQSDWSALTDLQTQYPQSNNILWQLNLTEFIDQLDDQQYLLLKNCMVKLLNQQQQLRCLVGARRDQLGQLIGETVNQRNQIQCYQHVAKLL